MSADGDQVTVTLPRDLATEMATITAERLDRMHGLLERSAEDQLSAVERSELETLVRMVQFSQLLATALRAER